MLLVKNEQQAQMHEVFDLTLEMRKDGCTSGSGHSKSYETLRTGKTRRNVTVLLQMPPPSVLLQSMAAESGPDMNKTAGVSTVGKLKTWMDGFMGLAGFVI